MPYASKKRVKAHLSETKPKQQNPFWAEYIQTESAIARDISFCTMVPANYHQHTHTSADAADQGKQENTTLGV